MKLTLFASKKPHRNLLGKNTPKEEEGNEYKKK